MEYNRIMVAIDPDSEGDAPVFAHALSLATAGRETHLLIAAAIDPVTAAELTDSIGTLAQLDSSSAQDALQHQRSVVYSRTQALLDGLSQEARACGGITAQTSVQMGQPGPMLCHLAREWKADLFVLGLTRRGQLVDCLLGSVTQYVVHHAPCSVLLVH